MDPNKCAQDALLCALCKENTDVKMLCTVCSMYMCKECVGEHLSDSKYHQVINFKHRNDILKYPECKLHEKHSCEMLCKDCEVYVCSKCMLYDIHGRHKFLDVQDAFKSKAAILMNDTFYLKEKIRPAYKKIVMEMEDQMHTVAQQYEKFSQATTEYGEVWHEIVNQCTNQLKEKLEKYKEQHLNVLKKEMEKIQQVLSHINHNIEENNEILNSGDVAKSLSYKSALKQFDKMPPKITGTLSKFQLMKIDKEKFYEQFGCLGEITFGKEERGCILSLKAEISPSHERPKVSAVFNTGHPKLRSIAYFSEKEIWTCGRSSELKCFDVKGQLKECLRTKSKEPPNDITVTKYGQLIYCDNRGTVNFLKNGQFEEVIKLIDWTPKNLCLTSSDDLLIMMYSHDFTHTRVVRYANFKEVQTIQFDHNKKPLYSENVSTKYICENRNRDICVSDSRLGSVVVVNKAGKLRFKYCGNSSSDTEKPFIPFGICVNSYYHILIADCNNNSIHIIDHDGKFLCKIDNCGLENPCGICLDKNEHLLIAEQYSGNVKKILF